MVSRVKSIDDADAKLCISGLELDLTIDERCQLNKVRRLISEIQDSIVCRRIEDEKRRAEEEKQAKIKSNKKVHRA